ncbi:hypothetical protein NP234_24520, partial [Salmonella enterica]|nr:hypothetical protein [Salmonella enterica]
RVETAFAYTPAGRLARTVCALIAPADSIEGGAVDDDMPFGSYTVTHMDEGGNPVQALTYSLPDGRVTKSAQWRNTYDSVGRLTSTVRTEWAALCDSVAVVYDVAAERGSAAPDSASRIGRVWMRLAGFFARVKGTLAHDTVAVAVPEAVDSLEDGLREERLLFEWAGKWKCVRREQLAYGPDGELVTEYSYCRPNGSAEWRVVRKVTYEYDGGRVLKAVSSAESANGGGIEAEWERKSLYY